MPDHTFFSKGPALSLEQIAEITGARLRAGVDGSYMIEDVAALDAAGPQDLAFLDNLKYRDQFHQTKAGACFVSEALAPGAPDGVHVLITETPYKAFALAAQAFYPDPVFTPGIAPQAHVHDTAVIGAGSCIEPGVVIGPNVTIGPACYIGANTVIEAGVRIGQATRIAACATISHAHIGDHVQIYTGARIGQDGFGFAMDPAGHVKVPQLGRVIIEDHVHIGANTTIDRGAGPDTVIGQGTWIDNLVQIGHNVKIGRGCIIVAQVGISGSTVLEDFVALGGQAGIAGHLHLGSGARIAAQSGVMRDIPAGEEHMGYPALPIKRFMRQVAALNRLIKSKKRD